jgi:lipoprotein-anchoring transpeptidase ErfK/SrfK
MAVTGQRGRHVARRRWAGPLRITALVAAVVLLALAIGGYAYARTTSGQLLHGVEVAGVDVSGMTRPQAMQAVQRAVTAELSRSITVQAAGKTWTTSPAQLGVTADVAGAVDEAFAASDAAWPVLAFDRLTHRSLGASIDVAYTYPTDQAAALVATIAKSVNRSPRSASMGLTGDDLTIVHPHDGRAVKVSTGETMLVGAMKDGTSSVTIPVRTVQPKITAKNLGKTITVDVSTNTLHLYNGFKVERAFPVATAMQGFTTPIGQWKVIVKEASPSWTNPAPNGWAKDMPKYIPPGPGNPLGLRALALNSPGILIHGTPEESSIGSYASHGCIRMHEDDAIALFPLVPQGTPVIIYGAPPWGNSSSTAPAGF